MTDKQRQAFDQWWKERHGGLPVVGGVLEAWTASRKLALEDAARLVLDDAWALTFQTFGQYRTALAAAIMQQQEGQKG